MSSKYTHGTRLSYVKGCRCGICTRANRKYHAKREAAARGEVPEELDFFRTRKEIAEELGITEEGVRQIENRALAKMEKRLRAVGVAL